MFAKSAFNLKLCLMLLAGKTVNSFLRNFVWNCCWLKKHIIPSYWMEFQNIFFLSFHWIPIDWWKSVQPIKYKVYTELIKLANFFNKRQRKKEILLLWERERIHFGWCLEIHLTLSWSIDSPTAIGGEDIYFLPIGWNKKNVTKYINWMG